MDTGQASLVQSRSTVERFVREKKGEREIERRRERERSSQRVLQKYQTKITTLCTSYIYTFSDTLYFTGRYHKSGGHLHHLLSPELLGGRVGGITG